MYMSEFFFDSRYFKQGHPTPEGIFSSSGPFPSSPPKEAYGRI